ncbi:MAG TPA: trehalose-phosphatase [Nocardioidaceae bacterium]|nr:trehalose-phosphatase [Nocardioidaceae bacterium]
MAGVDARTEQGRAGLAALVHDPGSALVAFDFDGTLAPIVPDPAQARAHPGAVAALTGLARHVGHTAIITGRPAATAVEYAGLRGAPGLADLTLLGHYGLERWDPASDQVSAPAPPAGVEQVRQRLPALLESAKLPDAYVEDKGTSLGVHTRRLPDPQEAFDRLRQPLQDLADEVGLVLEPGRLVLELRPRGMDKGAALRALVEELGARTVAFVGDDLGDLPAFDAVDALRAEGLAGLLVCSGSTEEAAVAERADVVVDGPEGVVALLRALTALLDRR